MTLKQHHAPFRVMTSALALLGLAAQSGTRAQAQQYLYVADSDGFSASSGILRYNLDGSFAPSAGQSGASFVLSDTQSMNSNLDDPEFLTLGPDGNLYVSDENGIGNQPGTALLRYNGLTGAPAPSGQPGPSGTGPEGAYFNYNQVGFPAGLTFGPDGDLYVVNDVFGDSVVDRYGLDGTFLGAFTQNLTPGHGVNLSNPLGLTFGPNGNLYVTSDSFGGGSGFIAEFDGTTGAFIKNFVAPGSGGLVSPTALTFGPDNDLYVVDAGGAGVGGVLRYDGQTGAFLNTFVAGTETGAAHPADAAFGPDGDLYLAAFSNYGISRYDSRGRFVDYFVPNDTTGTGRASGGLINPTALTFGPRAAVPEPSSWALLLVGGMALGLRLRAAKRRRAS
ncbi:MAG: PEP-CTERM sorting domain-containing protein [Armatimonadetes bacterium]|nr:PEP-CTERM sorting domain-containing protein [Armatimonadota bacterium]